jgi:hypothetical protein
MTDERVPKTFRESNVKRKNAYRTDAAFGADVSRVDHRNVLALQRAVGNQGIQTIIGARAVSGQRIQRDPTTGGEAAAGTTSTAPPATMDYSTMSEADLRAQYALIQFTLMTLPLASLIPLWEQEAAKIKQALIDKTVKAQIQSLLSQFQIISVAIPGTSQPLAPGQLGPPAPKRVTFHAAYFINTDTAQANVKGARDKSDFDDIADSVNATGSTSLLEGGGKKRKSGRAVQYGKSTPQEVEQFVQQALDNGTIQTYAIQQGKMKANQQLGDLGDAAGEVVQSWVIDNGVGVDCSGFVQQAAIHARDAVRSELQGMGIPQDKLPKSIKHEERNAASFADGAEVKHPADLHPGDAWVLNNGKHVKIIMEVRQATNDKGDPIIEFDTAESSGDSTHTATGPTQKTVKTNSLTQFGVGGSFHRIPQ